MKPDPLKGGLAQLLCIFKLRMLRVLIKTLGRKLWFLWWHQHLPTGALLVIIRECRECVRSCLVWCILSVCMWQTLQCSLLSAHEVLAEGHLGRSWWCCNDVYAPWCKQLYVAVLLALCKQTACMWCHVMYCNYSKYWLSESDYFWRVWFMS